MQVACDVKRLPLENEAVNVSKIIEDHESDDDSPISRV